MSFRGATRGSSKRLAAIPALLLICLEAQSAPQADDIAALSLAELGEVPAVVSAKPASQLFDTPAGAFVFDEAFIQSLPVDSMPEMLRYAPGVHISRPSNGIWGIGMRGINSRFFNRVQFTVDEQNVYSSIFAGLFGSQHDLLMDDVSSVEVAYGPGGGTWDNNAVNGRINVLMKTAFETEGALLATSLGSESIGAAARLGWAIDEQTSARVFLKAGQREPSLTRFDYSNRWDTARGGFRLDRRPTSSDLLSFSGEAFYSQLGYAYNLADFATGDLRFRAEAETLRGANTQLKWTRNLSDESAYSIRSWISYSTLDSAYAAFDMATAGLEGRARLHVAENHFLNLNLGGAYDQEDTYSTLASDFTEPHISNHALYSGLQHEWSLPLSGTKLSWGLDLRHEGKSSITSLSPNFRLIQRLSERDRLWLSYSRAERTTPVSLVVIDSLRSGRVLDDIISLPAPEGNIAIDRSLTDANSSRELDPEILDAFEAGYRRQLLDGRGAFWINAFHYRYDQIFARIATSATFETSVPHPYLNIQGTYENLLRGEGRGFEAYLDWRLDDNWRATLSYSRLSDSFEPLIQSADPVVADSIQFSLDEFDHSAPDHMATLNLIGKLASRWQAHAGLRYSSGYDFPKGRQPSIFQLDARLSWQINDTTTLSLVGRNLLDPYVHEARLKDFFGHWTEMKREAYLEAKAEF